MAFTAHANLYDREHQVLLSMDGHSQHMGSSAWTETIKTAPIFTSGAGKLVDEDPHLPGYEEFGLLGQQLELMDPHTGAGSAVPQGDDSRVFLNGNAPLSAFICGVQGAGKSNSLACMLGAYPFCVCVCVCVSYFVFRVSCFVLRASCFVLRVRVSCFVLRLVCYCCAFARLLWRFMTDFVSA